MSRSNKTADRRKYTREYARERRAKKLDARNASAKVCQKGLGAGICGGVLVRETDGNGRVVTTCPNCERQRRGVCRVCGLRVAGRVGRAIHCAEHQRRRRASYSRHWRERNPKLHRRLARQYYQTDAAKRRARNEYKRLWRQANREKTRAAKRRYALKGRARAVQARRRERMRTMPKPITTRSPDALRTCLTPGCEIVVTGMKKKCTKCRERERITALEKLAHRQRQRAA